MQHEDWNYKRVQGMAKVWDNPLSLLNDPQALQRDRHWRLINEIFSLVEGHSILDVGCGMGHLYALTKKKYDYIGLDSSEAMIKQAHEYFPQNKDGFEVGSAYKLWKYPIMDTVVASGLILHLPDPKPVLTELWSKVRICLVFSAWVGETPIMWKGRQPLIKRVLGIKPKDKYIIQRRDTIIGLCDMLYKLGVKRIAHRPFENPFQGESNYLFKVWKVDD